MSEENEPEEIECDDLLSADDLASKTDRRYKTLPLLTGGSVRIRSLSALEMRVFQAAFSNKNGTTNEERANRIEVLLMANCLVDKRGELATSEAAAMSGKFDNMDGAVLAQIYESCRKWTGYGLNSDFAALEEEVKNLRAISGDSSS